MGRLAKVLDFVRAVRGGANVTDTKAQPGADPNVTAQHFSPAGDDAHPMPGDLVALLSDVGAGRETAVGYLDIKNAGKTAPGDKRIYARDAEGDPVVELWLKNTGQAVLSNATGSITLNPDGSVVTTNASGTLTLNASGTIDLNGAIVGTDGSITSPVSVSAPSVAGSSSLTAAGKEIAGHTHPAGSPPGNTGANN